VVVFDLLFERFGSVGPEHSAGGWLQVETAGKPGLVPGRLVAERQPPADPLRRQLVREMRLYLTGLEHLIDPSAGLLLRMQVIHAVR
jgi:hypothetical protein